MWMREVTVGLASTQCYLVGLEDRKDCVVIDPGDEADRIRKAAEGRKIAAILLTHGHFDHIGAVRELMGDCPRLVIHTLDREMLRNSTLNAGLWMLHREVTAPDPTDLVKEGDVLHLAGMEIKVLHTPGHTQGSVCYEIGNELFTGDTLFEHGWGRTDLPGGDEHEIMMSLRRLMPMARQMPIHPGHEG